MTFHQTFVEKREEKIILQYYLYPTGVCPLGVRVEDDRQVAGVADHCAQVTVPVPHVPK